MAEKTPLVDEDESDAAVTRTYFDMGYRGAKAIGYDNKIMGFLKETAPFITCTAGEAPNVTLRFWNLKQAQDFHQMLIEGAYQQGSEEA